MALFGVPLQELVKRQQAQYPELPIPIFVKNAIKFITLYGLGENGIFRVEGNPKKIQQLKDAFNRGEKIDWVKEFGGDIDTLCHLLKLFFRDLPNSLLNSNLYDQWLAIFASETETEGARLPQVQEMLKQLDTTSFETLKYLIAFLSKKVAFNSPANKMDASNLGKMFGPNLLFKKAGKVGGDGHGDGIELPLLQDLPIIIELTTFLITHYPVLFTDAPEKLEYKLMGHKVSVLSLVLVPALKRVWSSDARGAIKVWDAISCKLLGDIKGVDDVTKEKTVLQHHDGVVWSSGDAVRAWDATTGGVIKEFPFGASALAVAEGKIWAGAESKLRIIDARKQELVKEISLAPGLAVLYLATVNNTVWCATADKIITVRSSTTFEVVKEMPHGHNRHAPMVLTQGYVWVASVDNTVFVIDPTAYSVKYKLKGHTARITCLTSSGELTISASWDKSMHLWNSRVFAPLKELKGYHTDSISSVLIMPPELSPPNIVRLWSTAYDRSICVWNVPSADLAVQQAPPQARPTPPPATAPTTQQPKSPQGQPQTAVHRAPSPAPSPSPASAPTPSTAAASSPVSPQQGGASGSPKNRKNNPPLDIGSDSDSDSEESRRVPRTPSLNLSGSNNAAKWEINPNDIVIPPNSKLGEGSFGVVYKGKLYGREVAVKRLNSQNIDEKTLESFRKEIDIMSKLSHPNVLLFMGACSQPPNLLIVMDLMPRGSVHDLLHNPSVNISFKQKMKWARDTTLAMNWLHLNRPVFIHRDLKTANLLVDANWSVKVCDFGLTLMKQQNEKNKRYGAIGTPLWMAPEVILNREYDESCDLYSFGIVLWEMLTRQEPYSEINSFEDLVQLVCLQHFRPKIPADCPDRLKQILTACWHPRPDKRPTFNTLLPEWNHLIIDQAVRDSLGRKFWKENFLERDVVPWAEFSVAFQKFIGVFDEDAMSGVKFMLVKATPDESIIKEDRVTVEDFGGLLEWFGPLEGKPMLDRIEAQLRMDGFQCFMSTPQAEELLHRQEKKGTYLIRFSSSEPGYYGISVKLDKSTIRHYRIVHRAGTQYVMGDFKSPSLQGILVHFQKELNLKIPVTSPQPYDEWVKRTKAASTYAYAAFPNPGRR